MIVQILGILGAAFHVTMGATIGVALFWPHHSRGWAVATVGFWALYQAIRVVAA